METVKILKELRENMKELRVDIKSNADHYRKELETIRRSKEKNYKIHLQRCKLS